MQSLITSYLLQSRECVLPGIGVLQIIHTPASTDAANNRVLPPFEEIIFKKENHSKSPGLVKYIADKKHIEQSEAEDILNNFCSEWKEKINAGGKLNFETVGSIQKNADGIISFVQRTPSGEREGSFNFLHPIAVNDPYRKAEEHVSINEEPVLSEANVVEEEVVVERSYWGLWAMILLAIGSVMIFYHFKDHKLSGSTIGNQNHFAIDSATATYHLGNK
jgi:hypothetical protein